MNRLKNFELLLNIFKQYNTIYISVFNKSNDKIELITKNKFADLSEINDIEKKLLTKIKILENNRINLVNKIIHTHNIKDNNIKIEELLNYCNNDKLKKNIIEEKEKLNKVLLVIKDNNTKLSMILNKTVSVINYSIEFDVLYRL